MILILILLASLQSWAQGTIPIPTQSPSAAPAPAESTVAKTQPEQDPQKIQDSEIQLEQTQLQVSEDLREIIEVYVYDPRGKRDPFIPYTSPVAATVVARGPLLPLQKFEIDQLKLVGVITGGRTPMAMIIDPKQKVHYVKKNAKIGRDNGYVAKIREGELVIIENYVDPEGNTNTRSRLMKLDRAKTSK